MNTITYSLRNTEKTSDKFYAETSDFTDEILDYASGSIIPEINKFRRFLVSGNKEKLRTEEEYLFEYLMIGVFWIQYSYAAITLNKLPQKLLASLVNLRQTKKAIKNLVDYLRGLMGTYFLYPGIKSKSAFAAPSSKNFSLLIGWLTASGEFKEEVKRLCQWQNYFESGENDETLIITEAIKFAQWFETRSVQVLGKYTEGLDGFLNEKLEEHYWKEDIIFCARSRVEYHLNMVGAEVMNRAFKDDFMQADTRAVLIPACMRALPDEGQPHPSPLPDKSGQALSKERVCKAERKGLDYICTNCTSYCRVHQLNMMGKRENFSVYIIPHSSDFSQWLQEHGVNSGVGTVGVACINNLISGGLELKSLNIPAQCVLLDYCGCKGHWDKKGFPTDINICRLKTIMKQAKYSTLPGQLQASFLTMSGQAKAASLIIHSKANPVIGDPVSGYSAEAPSDSLVNVV